MRHHSRLANLPERFAVGGFILNSGLTKLQADKETASGIHGMAAGTYPMLEEVPPEGFTKALGMAEVALGGTLLLPLIGDGLAGAALAAFAGGLLGLYVKTPGMRQEGGLRPSQQGTALAKDVWLLGVGLSLIGHSAGARRQSRKTEKAHDKARHDKARHDKARHDKARHDKHTSHAASAAKKAAKAAATAKAAKSVLTSNH